MRHDDAGLTFRATDLSTYSGCRHAVLLDREVAHGRLTRPYRGHDDPAAKLRNERGLQHEARYRKVLENRGLDVFAAAPGALKTRDQWKAATERTRAAISAGHDVIHQAALARGDWCGIADFLVRVTPRGVEPPLYEVADAKLAVEARAAAVLQLCVYSAILAELQGHEPERLFIVSPGRNGGDPVEHPLRSADYGAYFRHIRNRFEQFAKTAVLEESYPEPVESCDSCDFWRHCDKRRRDDDHLSFVSGMLHSQQKHLEAAGVRTLTRLALVDVTTIVRSRGLSQDSLKRLQQQARLQLEARSAPPRIELLTPEKGRGLCRLPEPSPGDIFLDIESDRYDAEGAFHYLVGWLEFDENNAPQYTALWARTRAEERVNFERFIDHVDARRRNEKYRNLHLFHFAPFEHRALGEMMSRYASREAEVDDLLRNDVLVDLMPIAKQGLRAGVESYSLKDLEQFHAFERKVDLRDAGQSRRLFELQRNAGTIDEAVIPIIEGYNFEDCSSTASLRAWLEQQRGALIAGGCDVPRAPKKDEPPSTKVSDWTKKVEAVRRQLLVDLPEQELERSTEHRARQLLADLVDWHRREDKPYWWEQFRLADLSSEELVAESSTIGVLGPEMDRGKEQKKGSRSNRFEFSFPPQECTIEVGDRVYCPVTSRGVADFEADARGEKKKNVVGEVIEIDPERGFVAVKRTGSKLAVPPQGLAVEDYISPDPIPDALMSVAEALAKPGFGIAQSTSEWGTTEPVFRAARALLLREAPRLKNGATLLLQDEESASAAQRVAPLLDCTVLPVQGPPGAGKTYTGSRMILAMLNAGLRVGITASSHKVIAHLLDGVHKAADESKRLVRSLQKPSGSGRIYEYPEDAERNKATDAAKARKALDSGEVKLVAGTAWFWCNEKMRDSIDVLVVDEAGQFSLANAVAISAATESMVLLGDPQQLAQPSKGTHPPGAERSALEHLLAGHETVSDSKGLFLDRTWRLPPRVVTYTSTYFYQGRLQSHETCKNQRLTPAKPEARFKGTGIFFEPVSHEGNVTSCKEEAERVAEIVSDILSSGTKFVDRKGVEHTLTAADVLVVAPYNAQVRLIQEHLSKSGQGSVRVGSVDRFQGQEAPVVVYSMATSAPEDAPRTLDFLFSLNRLNVATSRAQAIAILVANPRLIEAECKTPERMKLVNAVCGAVEAGNARLEDPPVP
jgi:predicted RecB family nuclease